MIENTTRWQQTCDLGPIPHFKQTHLNRYFNNYPKILSTGRAICSPIPQPILQIKHATIWHFHLISIFRQPISPKSGPPFSRSFFGCHGHVALRLIAHGCQHERSAAQPRQEGDQGFRVRRVGIEDLAAWAPARVRNERRKHDEFFGHET